MTKGVWTTGTFDQGITEVVAAVLAQPRLPVPLHSGSQGRGRKNSEFPLSDLELASRLSFFLWNSGPDDELLALAGSGRLTHQPGVFEAQVKRMMADPKAESLVTSFAMKWLNLNSLDLVQARPEDLQWLQCYPPQGFHDGSREVPGQHPAGEQECRRFADLRSHVRKQPAGASLRNEGPSTSAFKEVTLTDPNRFGLLGKAAVLMRTSYGGPHLSGAARRLGARQDHWHAPTPPPPNVDTNLAASTADAPKTVRARLEMHRDKAACKQCHGCDRSDRPRARKL